MKSLDVVMWSLAGKKNLSRVDVRRVVSAAKEGSRTDGDRSRVGCSQHSRFHLPRLQYGAYRMLWCIIENPVYVFLISA